MLVHVEAVDKPDAADGGADILENDVDTSYLMSVSPPQLNQRC